MVLLPGHYLKENANVQGKKPCGFRCFNNMELQKLPKGRAYRCKDCPLILIWNRMNVTRI